MTQIKNNRKLIAIVAVVLVLAVLAVLAFAFGLFGKRSGYAVTLYRADGQGEIERAGEGALPAAAEMALRSGDVLRTGADGGLYVRMDGGKYLFADADTSCAIEAGGTSKANDTLLTLENGTLMLHLMNALGADSSFAVSTADARFEARAASFRVDAGQSGTSLYVFDGKVTATPAAGGEAQTFTRGQYVKLSGGRIVSVEDEIDYESLSLESLSFLNMAAEKGKILSIPAARLQEIIAHNGGMLLVKFTVGGEVFGTQSVAYGEHAHAPKLLPAPEGEWDFDFSTPVTSDLEIVWRG